MPFMAFGASGLVALALIAIFVKPWFTEAQDSNLIGATDHLEQGAAGSIWSREPLILAAATTFAGLAIYGYLGLYPTFLREALGFTPKQAGLAVSFYGLGALLSLLGGWLGDKYGSRKLLLISLVISAVAGGLLFTGLGRSLPSHLVFSLVFGAAISGMVYANLSAGIIKSVKRAGASHASGLFVASLYVPAAFAGFVLGRLKESVGWSAAGVLQVSGCALVAAVLSMLAANKARGELQRARAAELYP
jgi:sugar phosphate permease